MRITINKIPHAKQRYPTCGDWEFFTEFTPNDLLSISVSEEMGGDSCFLVAMHELIEVKLCMQHGVTQQQVDDFDMTFKGDGEPGDDPAAPYHKEHLFATLMERKMAKAMGVNWDEHEARINAL